MKSRYVPLLAALLLFLGLHASPAKADSITYSFSGFGTTATFTLQSNPTPSVVGSDYFQLNNVTISIAGIGDETANLDFFTSAAGGGIGSGGNRLGGAQLFSGTLASPTLLTGSFPLSGTVTPDANGAVPVSGSLIATALGPVPEPSSLLLLLTGAAGSALALRRRLRAANAA